MVSNDHSSQGVSSLIDGAIDKKRVTGWAELFLNRPKILLLSVVCLLVAVLAFHLSHYRHSTLVIEARTFDKGTGKILVENSASSGVSQRTFALIDDQGVRQLYVIELPDGTPQAMTIPPLAQKGRFGIIRLTLSNSSISYDWDEQGLCSRKTLVNGIAKQEPCGGVPQLSTADDGATRISSIPEEGFVATDAFRGMVAVGAFLVVCICGIWLACSTVGEGREKILWYGNRIVLLVLVTLYLLQLMMVLRYAVDIPFGDEWNYFQAQGLSQGLTWEWLFRFHNEHRIVLTKFLAWLNLQLFGLDFVVQKVLNFLMFGGLIVAVFGFKKRLVGPLNFPLFAAFIIFLLSSIARENHLWAFQSQFHLVLIFSVLALPHVCPEKLSIRGTAVYCLLLLLAMYTISAGIVFAVIYLLCTTIFTAGQMIHKRVDHRTGWQFMLVCGTIITVGIVLSRVGYEPDGWSPQRIYPFEALFWEHFLNLVSFGFGFERVHLLPGFVCLLVTLTPLVLLLIDPDARWNSSTWQLLAAILGILAVLAAISIGRAYFAEPKTSRYAEVAFMLVPYVSLAWWLALRAGRMRSVVLLSLWMCCLFSFGNNWSTDSWAFTKQVDIYNLECVEGYFKGIGDGVCQGRTTAEDLDRAKQLNVRFTRQFTTTLGKGN